MRLEEIPFTSLASRQANQRIPFDLALIADNLYTDQDCITPRGGSRSVTTSAITGSGAPQHMGRFRPTFTSARTVVVIAGEVFLVTDPTSETASDGTVVSLGVVFGTTASISGAQLDTSYYLSTDEDGVPWVRINWTSPDSYALENLKAIPQGANPTASVNTTLAWTPFTTLASWPVSGANLSGMVVQTNSNTGFTNMNSAWRGFSATNNGDDDPAQGAFAEIKLDADTDWSGYDWLIVAVSPHDNGSSNSQSQNQVKVQLGTGTAAHPANLTDVGSIYDVPPVAGSPNLIYCDLRQIGSTVRSAVRWIKFLLDGTLGGKFIIYGFLALPGEPVAPSPRLYYVDFLNAATGEFSALTAAATLTGNLPVTIPQAGTSNYPLPGYPDSYMTVNHPASSGATDLLLGTDRNFNLQAGKPFPALTDIGAAVTVSGTTSNYTGTMTVRLWEQTPTGIRLVTSQAGVAANTAYSLTDGGGIAVLANQIYIPGGTPPQATAITAQAQRLIAVFKNRVFISSFVPTANTSNPFPQWPDIAVEDDDGWSFDFCPSPREIGLAVNGDGDALYIISDEAWYFMSDLTPNSPVFQVFRRGVLGTQGAKFFEDRMFVMSWDGVFVGVGRTNPVELSEVVRRTYQDWLIPDQNSVIGYDAQARALFVYQDNRYMRYRFPTEGLPGKWTRGILSSNIRMASTWIGRVNTIQTVIFTDAWAGMTMLQNLQTRANWNKHPASTDNMAYVNTYAPTGVATSRSNLALYYRSETPTTADYEAVAGVYQPITEFGGETYGPAVRISTTLDTFYAFVLTPLGICNLIKHVAGVETVLATYTIPGWSATTFNWANLKVKVVGTTIQGWIQGPGVAPGTPPSGDYVLRCSVVDTAISAVGKAGIYGFNGGSAFYISGASASQAAANAVITNEPQLWLLDTNRFISRWQPSATRDVEIGTDATTGTALPDWKYSTGFAKTTIQAKPTRMVVDGSGLVNVKVAKTVEGNIPTEARAFDTQPYPGQDEVEISGVADMKAFKWRIEFSGKNDVELRAAWWGREPFEAVGG